MKKRLVILADGTGNAFSTQESNVWRLYCALDKSQPDQIVAYIQGVGTSGFKPFAILDGATGLGVPSNVRKLFEFICWNWEKGDEIYMFGFSRGAFTIRTLIGLLASEGVLPRQLDGEPIGKAEMQRNVMAAWRAYRRKTVPLSRSLPTIWVTRLVRDILLFALRVVQRRRGYGDVSRAAETTKAAVRITFAGLFDTVEAYGVPIEELRVAVDWAIWPISFRNNVLSPQVERARHALSLDDQRVTFHPLRFDMTNETDPERIKEIWFTGAHSDVGGGYVDGELALVPLIWIVDDVEEKKDTTGQVAKPGLRFEDGVIQSFREQASSYAAKHDSREGTSTFYRYGPRPIGEGKVNGGPPIIHHAVAERIAFGADRYAPLTLPSTALVSMPDGSTVQISGFSDNKAFASNTDVASEAVRKLSAPIPRLVSLARDAIWWRRVNYFSLLIAAIGVLSLPLSAPLITSAFRQTIASIAAIFGGSNAWEKLWSSLSSTNNGIAAVLADTWAYIGFIFPSYLKPWTDAFADWPLTCSVVLLITIVLYRGSNSLRDKIADLAREAWQPDDRTDATKNGMDDSQNTFARVMRKSTFLGLLNRFFSRIVFPAVTLAVLALFVVVAVSRGVVTHRDGSGKLCTETASAEVVRVSSTGATARELFRTESPCWASGLFLQEGHRYALQVKMVQPFFDQTILTDINGFRDNSIRHTLALPILRWWSADWFQLIGRIGPQSYASWAITSDNGDKSVHVGQDRSGRRIPIRFFEAPAYAARLKELATGDPGLDPSRLAVEQPIPEAELEAARDIWRSHDLRDTLVTEFTAPASGELFLFVNDALIGTPSTFYGFYKNNSGTATVTVKELTNSAFQ